MLQNERKRKQFSSISPEAGKLLTQYPWPGNVRELENAIERAVLIHSDTVLRTEHLDFLLTSGKGQEFSTTSNSQGVLDLRSPDIVLPDHPFVLDDLTSTVIQKALEKFGGNKTKAAEYLGISRYALYRKIS